MLREDTVRARNLCHARTGDKVNIGADFLVMQYRNSMTKAGAFLAFILGSAILQIVFYFMHIQGAYKLLILVPGVVTGTASYFIIRKFYQKHPLPPTAAVEVVAE
jgi:uncharacterized membrane protein